jgi:UDP-N-acetylglucosamine--dolichyl-phosphate N-acetylglucosaminephosphotransferase
MINLLLLSVLGLSFASTIFFILWWIPKARKAGLTGKDMNKLSKPEIAEVGGLPVLFGFLTGVLLFIGHRTFIQGITENLIEILGIITTITIIAIIGLIDDILGWKIGIKQYQKPLLCIFAALPLMMINAGKSFMVIPLIGTIDLGLLYPLLIVPFILIFTSNSFNMLAGYNGLEAGMGIIILSTLGFLAWQVEGLSVYAVIAAIMIMCLLAFLMFNWHPARIFPGDSLTYMVGALIGTIAILTNQDKALLILFIPYYLEIILFIRILLHKIKAEAFAKVNPDGSLTAPYKKVFDTTHIAIKFLSKIKRKVYEKDVVYTILAFEIFIALVVLMFFI